MCGAWRPGCDVPHDHTGKVAVNSFGVLLMYKVQEDGCWKWIGPTCANGRYGRVTGAKQIKMAHRKAYEDAFGKIAHGMCVCHACDNSLCVNPEHLFLGSHSDNMRDAAKKHRLPHLLNQSGEKNSNAKYSKEFADEVRRYYAEHRPSFAVLAEKFGLKSKGHAHAIVTNKLWK